MKRKIDLIFSIVNFNTEDELVHLIKSSEHILKSENISYHFVIVNNFSTNESFKNVENLKSQYKFDLIQSDNVGYGNGHNKAILYIKKHYEFKNLVVSNCDIEMIEVNKNVLDSNDGILGPAILKSSGVNQNPMYINRHKTLFHLYNYVRQKPIKLLFYATVLYSKLLYGFDSIFSRKNMVYCVHGSFIIFSEASMELLNYEPFEKNMFLFCEENVIAEKAFTLNIPIYNTTDIKVLHFEDASMNKSNINQHSEWKKSYKIFYNKYIQGK